ncbi:MAG: carbohydrate ABC transporter permease [candidate division Zixibacteria bacterium]|nr:carbohydrate ABC transporter permease [candidate division Zixibacteria bacterium]
MKVPKYILLVMILVIMIFPLIWMFRVSLMPANITANLGSLFVSKYTLLSYYELFTSSNMLMYLFNSILVGIIVTVGNIFFCFMAGYAFSRYHFLGKNLWFYSIILVLMIPAHIVIIPLYLLIHKLGFYDTYWALILPFLVSPIGIFLVKQYIDTLPSSIEEAARMDGAGELKILLKIVMPLCRPVLAVLAIQVFMTNWNSFLFPLILTSSESVRTLPVGLALYQGYQAIDWPHLMAGSSLAVIPILVVFLFFQRQIVSGITAGAIKQ